MSVLGSQRRVLLHSPPPALSNQTALEPFLCPGNSLHPSGFGGREGGRSCLCAATLQGPFPSSPELQWGSVGLLLRLVVRGDGNGTPVGMAALTVSPVAQRLWPFLSVPNFSPLLCSAVPMFTANCPFSLEPMPALLRDRMGPKASLCHLFPPMGLSGAASVSPCCPWLSP